MSDHSSRSRQTSWRPFVAVRSKSDQGIENTMDDEDFTAKEARGDYILEAQEALEEELKMSELEDLDVAGTLERCALVNVDDVSRLVAAGDAADWPTDSRGQNEIHERVLPARTGIRGGSSK
ncbi:hypothetical protein MKZ38_006477 [Zalerion maritima]|uniref:Uncharacterized protein n=1 Tax=Zalerion maritima TaxID=339359 RepID=A0AAD5WYQ1_9PEZI|nr:hypothetical protein MKZ38_006477 [Zalerion maritima]